MTRQDQKLLSLSLVSLAGALQRLLTSQVCTLIPKCAQVPSLPRAVRNPRPPCRSILQTSVAPTERELRWLPAAPLRPQHLLRPPPPRQPSLSAP